MGRRTKRSHGDGLRSEHASEGESSGEKGHLDDGHCVDYWTRLRRR